ncbi:MAG: hypothetical protein HKN01_10785 [Acidimicrobiia bacterium]|nr:hypothetical protein [Acidimicrobiia bacterium]
MTIAFAASVLAALIFGVVFVRYGEHRRSLAVLGIVLPVIFLGPSAYYAFDGTAYRVFTSDALDAYRWVSCAVFLIATLAFVFRNRVVESRLPDREVNDPSGDSPTVRAYLAFVALAVVVYVLVFLPRWPVVNLITDGELIRRPDSSGSIPFFFTASALTHVVLPSAYLLFREKLSTWAHLAALAGVATLLALPGHTGIVAFFFIFIWVYVFDAKFDRRLVAIVAVLLLAFAISKGSASLEIATWASLAASAVRRFFVTQGAGMIVRISMVSSGFAFGSEPIKNSVFEVIYGRADGSAPTHFIGDLIVRWGYGAAIASFVVFMAIVVVLGTIVDKWYRGNLFLTWHLYVVLYFFAMSEIGTANLLRLLVVVVNLTLVMFVLPRLHLERVRGFRWLNRLAEPAPG